MSEIASRAGEGRRLAVRRVILDARIEIDQSLAGFYVIGVFDIDANDRVVYARADRIEMPIDLGIVGPLVRLQVIPEARPADAQQGGNNQRQDYSDRTSTENTAATGGVPCAGVIDFVLLDLFSNLCVVRLRSSLKGFLVIEQVLNFKPQVLNFVMKAFLLFRYGRPGQIPFVIMRDRSVGDVRTRVAMTSVVIHCKSLACVSRRLLPRHPIRTSAFLKP